MATTSCLSDKSIFFQNRSQILEPYLLWRFWCGTKRVGDGRSRCPCTDFRLYMIISFLVSFHQRSWVRRQSSHGPGSWPAATHRYFPILLGHLSEIPQIVFMVIDTLILSGRSWQADGLRRTPSSR